MTDYQAPVRQMRFTIEHLADLAEVTALPDFSAVDADTIQAVLEEAAKFAGGVLAPINWLGDQQGVKVVDGAVQVPQEFTDAYRQFCEAGWPGIASNPEFGGQGLPKTVALACDEMWAAANVSFALCPELSQGAILAMDRHATEELKATYLEKLVSGQWAGTMCLTEPQAGSDLSSLTTRAEPRGDAYLVTGRKIYITWGDHPMAENIIHLVLARLPDAPAGTKGISLFVVPKFKLAADGSPGALNDVRAVSVEHKLGIHASPTCVLAFGDEGGAEGYLVGKPNEGLTAMFTMMNYMRLGVGAQGTGLSERSYQASVSYARERLQARAPGEKGRVAIIRHPDVRRMLLLMRSLTQASRAICYYTASCLDRMAHGTDAEAAENISREWAREVFGGLYEDRFRYVAALHHNTEQVHAHFVIDKVGMDEGRFLSIGRHSDINYDMMRQLHAEIAADHGLALNATTRLSRGLVEHAPRQADIQAAMEEGREPYAAPMSDGTRAEREAVVRSHAADYRELAALARVADDRDGWMSRLIGKATDAVARIEEGSFRMQDFADVNEVPAASLDAAGRLMAARETLLAEASNAWEKISEMDPGPERVSLEREFSEAAKATVEVFEKDAFFLSHASAVPVEADPYSVPMITALHDRADTTDGRFTAQADTALDRFMDRLEDAFRDRADLFEANGTSVEEMAARFASRERSEAQLEVWRPEDANERATWLEVERDLRREAEAVAMGLPMERELVEDLARDALLESRQGERLADLAALDRLVSEVRSDLGDGDMDRIASGELDPLMDAIRDPALRAAVDRPDVVEVAR